MNRVDLYAAVEEKMSHVVLQARAMLERELIKELPYDAADLAHAGLGMIDGSFRNACYHRDAVIIPKLGTFQPTDNSVQFASEHKWNVLMRAIPKMMAALDPLATLNPEEKEELYRDIHATMPELSSDDLCKVISESLAPLIISASPQEITEKILSVWEDTIADSLKIGMRVSLLGIGVFSFQPEIHFVSDDVLLRAIQAGDWRRRQNQLSPSEEI